MFGNTESFQTNNVLYFSSISPFSTLPMILYFFLCGDRYVFGISKNDELFVKDSTGSGFRLKKSISSHGAYATTNTHEISSR